MESREGLSNISMNMQPRMLKSNVRSNRQVQSRRKCLSNTRIKNKRSIGRQTKRLAYFKDGKNNRYVYDHLLQLIRLLLLALCKYFEVLIVLMVIVMGLLCLLDNN